jgi:cation transport ATPase
MFVGLAILYTSMGLLQRRERVIPMDEVQLRSVVRMTWVTVILAVYALLFFGITVNIQSGLTLALSVILIADPRWPSLWAGFRRFNILRDLSNQGVDFQNPRAIDAVADIKDLVIEKNGILSTQDDVRIHMVQSMDQRYSDFDIVGVAAGLMRNFPDEILADAITNFAQENGVYPSDASEPERTDFESVRGVIYNERFAIISVPVALRDYQIDERQLKLMADLGNSLAYVVDGQEAIGVIVYSATADFQAMPFDRFMGERGLVGHVMSTDMNLATHKMTDLLPNIMTVATELLPDEKVQAQAQWANTSHSMLVTNQDIPDEVRPAISVAMGERPGWADIRLDDLAKFPLLWQTNDRLQGADKGILTRTSIFVILLIILGTGMTMFINPLLFLPPVLAVTIRLVVSFTVASVVSSKKEH